MNKFNSQQKKLVEFVEKVHETGIRHGGLSGTLCEDYLITSIINNIDQLSFCRGQIILPSNNREVISSPQFDIIIYDKAYKTNIIADYLPWSLTNAIPLKYVKGVIEVKKWSSGKMFDWNSGVNASIRNFRKNVSNSLPYFFVSYRVFDRHDVTLKTWYELTRKLQTKYAYCFFGQFTRNKEESCNRYPWQEEGWDVFKTIYDGQYQKLIKDIKLLCLKPRRGNQ